jgi:hypothetical protein
MMARRLILLETGDRHDKKGCRAEKYRAGHQDNYQPTEVNHVNVTLGRERDECESWSRPTSSQRPYRIPSSIGSHCGGMMSCQQRIVTGFLMMFKDGPAAENKYFDQRSCGKVIRIGAVACAAVLAGEVVSLVLVDPSHSHCTGWEIPGKHLGGAIWGPV